MMMMITVLAIVLVAIAVLALLAGLVACVLFILRRRPDVRDEDWSHIEGI